MKILSCILLKFEAYHLYLSKDEFTSGLFPKIFSYIFHRMFVSEDASLGHLTGNIPCCIFHKQEALAYMSREICLQVAIFWKFFLHTLQIWGVAFLFINRCVCKRSFLRNRFLHASQIWSFYLIYIRRCFFRLNLGENSMLYISQTLGFYLCEFEDASLVLLCQIIPCMCLEMLF